MDTDGIGMFDVYDGKPQQSLGQIGVFADCEDITRTERFHWPDIKYCDFTAMSMDAESLSKKYGGKLVFIGGVDTRELLPLGMPQQIHDEVRRLIAIFGPNNIASPSHESLLPHIPPENIAAMAEAALE